MARAQPVTQEANFDFVPENSEKSDLKHSKPILLIS